MGTTYSVKVVGLDPTVGIVNEALDWFDDNYTAITGSLRYAWRRQFLSGTGSVRQFFRADGGNEMLNWRGGSSWHAGEPAKRIRSEITGRAGIGTLQASICPPASFRGVGLGSGPARS